MSQSSKRKTVKKNKPVTLAEFKAWLEGVEELQPADWSPDSNQWELIRNKMFSIVESDSDVNFMHVPQQPMQRPMPQQPVAPQAEPMPMVIPGPPVQSTSLPTVEPTMTPAARAAMQGRPIPGTPGPDGKIRTPNIDTSNGKYSTSFE